VQYFDGSALSRYSQICGNSCKYVYVFYAIRQSYFKNRQISEKQEAKNIEEVNFDVMDINNKVKLAITPLTQCKDIFLCIYLESPVAESYQVCHLVSSYRVILSLIAKALLFSSP
jgi:hypothetical protein